MWTKQTVFRRAQAADIAAIMEIERQPGYERLVGRWSAEEHLGNISSPGYLYLVHDDENGMPIAFAALSGLGAAHGEVRINRMIVRTPGQGIGRRFLDTLLETIFNGSAATRVWLNVIASNERARKLYRSAGLVERETQALAGRTPAGDRVDLVVKGITHEEWESRDGRSLGLHHGT